jgi:predicted enzyme related to lactoylglutathione lyase
MGQPVVHWEFWSDDPARVADFYQTVFGWNIRSLPGMNYRLVETGGLGGINGGIMKPQAGPWPSKLALYIEKIREAGGKIVVDKVDVPGVGQLSLFEDPEGRVLGMWKRLK